MAATTESWASSTALYKRACCSVNLPLTGKVHVMSASIICSGTGSIVSMEMMAGNHLLNVLERRGKCQAGKGRLARTSLLLCELAVDWKGAGDV
jgi:hypothetical protein